MNSNFCIGRERKGAEGENRESQREIREEIERFRIGFVYLTILQ